MRANGEVARPRIDLNADVGEGYADGDVMPFVSSANVACGAHAGDEPTMRATLALARAHGVAVGAHPGFPDRAGFGRRVTTREPAAIEELVTAQVARLAELAAQEGLVLRHVKPHGALYNLSAINVSVADAIARAVARLAPHLRLVGLAGSVSLTSARRFGLVTLDEAFVDRAYLADGTLAPRERTDALVTDPGVAAARAVALTRDGRIDTLDGREIVLRADTLCLHADTPGAAATARAVAAALRAAGVTIAAPT